MRLGILFVIEWLTRGTVAGMTCKNTRREFEKKLGIETFEDSLFRFGELEIAYYEGGNLDATPFYLMVDLFSENCDRWREEMIFLDPKHRELAEAICTLRPRVIAEVLEARGIRTRQFPPPRQYSWFVAVGDGAKMGCTFSEPEHEGHGMTLFLTTDLEDYFTDPT